MEFIGGKINPILQATKFRKLQRSYIDQIEKSEESISPSTNAINVAPIGGQTPIISDVMIKRKRKNSKIKFKSEFKSSSIINDPNLIIINSTLQERNLLNLAGLNIESSDYVLIIKDRQGGIKSAMAMKSNNNVINEINYIDVNSDGSNFKNGLVRLATLPNKPFIFSEQIEVKFNKIKEKIVK